MGKGILEGGGMDRWSGRWEYLTEKEKKKNCLLVIHGSLFGCVFTALSFGL